MRTARAAVAFLFLGVHDAIAAPTVRAVDVAEVIVTGFALLLCRLIDNAVATVRWRAVSIAGGGILCALVTGLSILFPFVAASCNSATFCVAFVLLAVLFAIVAGFALVFNFVSAEF